MALDVLVIDDDRDLIDLLKKYLAKFEINTLSINAGPKV
jgi:CheY-like chemotaxis protein